MIFLRCTGYTESNQNVVHFVCCALLLDCEVPLPPPPPRPQIRKFFSENFWVSIFSQRSVRTFGTPPLLSQDSWHPSPPRQDAGQCPWSAFSGRTQVGSALGGECNGHMP